MDLKVKNDNKRHENFESRHETSKCHTCEGSTNLKLWTRDKKESIITNFLMFKYFYKSLL